MEKLTHFSAQKCLIKTMQKDPEKLGHKPLFRVFYVGATDLIRTGDLLITSELLYQLSHSSTLHIFCNGQYFTIFQHVCQGWIFNR